MTRDQHAIGFGFSLNLVAFWYFDGLRIIISASPDLDWIILVSGLNIFATFGSGSGLQITAMKSSVRWSFSNS